MADRGLRPYKRVRRSSRPTTVSRAVEQLEGTEAPEAAQDGEQRSIEEIITDGIFGLQDPPRWIVLAHAGQLVLIDRTLSGRNGDCCALIFRVCSVAATRCRVFAAIASSNSVCPVGGSNLIDRLDEGSHKHAAKVSEDLKYNVREAIELLGNEGDFNLREVLKEKVYGAISAEELSRECLQLHPLLFIFYIEVCLVPGRRRPWIAKSIGLVTASKACAISP